VPSERASLNDADPCSEFGVKETFQENIILVETKRAERKQYKDGLIGVQLCSIQKQSTEPQRLKSHPPMQDAGV